MQILEAKQIERQILFNHIGCYESRGVSIENLIRETVREFKIEKNFSITVSPDDVPYSESSINIKYISTTTENYEETFPCFSFYFWPEVGIKDYSTTINNLKYTEPLFNKIGWIGFPMSRPRQIFCEEYCNSASSKNFCEAIINEWNRKDPKNLFKNTSSYMTYQEQINRWKYLIDFEGAGFSARTKVLLNSPRIIFIVDRPFKEFWYKELVPWKHFVPVKRDLSDLEENFQKIESNKTLQYSIKKEQQKFAKKHLSKKSALLQINNLIQKQLGEC